MVQFSGTILMGVRPLAILFIGHYTIGSAFIITNIWVSRFVYGGGGVGLNGGL